ncbi:MAG: hypothetical protein Q8Q33_03720, partial [Chlamydiota bacterium]|nr:hypothetical protein [Chlamydiota bacterium]
MKKSIKTKITALTISMIVLSLGISLLFSYQNSVQEKKNHAEKLMVNIAKQIGLLKSLKNSISDASFREYARKTVYASLSRKGFTIQIVYLLSTNSKGQLEIYIFNEKSFTNKIPDKGKLAQSLLLEQSPDKKTDSLITSENQQKSHLESSLQNTRVVSIQLSDKEHIQIGFSLHILESDILIEFYYHIILGILIIFLGV